MKLTNGARAAAQAATMLGAMIYAGSATAGGDSFLEEFNFLDTSRWYVSDGWNNGDWHGCTWSRNNALVTGGVLRLTIDTQASGDRPYSCGEIQTRSFYGYGTYEVRMRALAESGTVSAFFTYTGPVHKNPWDEIDIEVLGKSPGSFQANYYVNGKGDKEKIVTLGFDSSAAMHNYAFVWAPDMLRWYVDGRLVHEATSASGPLPTTESKLYMSVWNGRGTNMEGWLGKFAPTRFVMEMEIDRVSFTAPGAPCQYPDSIVCALGTVPVSPPPPETSPEPEPINTKPGNNKGGRKK
jgi:endo-1,3-1,4-beta-glycanase ExoK